MKNWLRPFAKATFILCLFFSGGRSVYALYPLGTILPGDAVDPLTDVSEYSFSVPHALSVYGGMLRPGYSYTNQGPDSVLDYGLHTTQADGFGYASVDKLRLGVTTRNTSYSDGHSRPGTISQNKLMLSYFWTFLSLGVEAAASRATFDSPRDRWGGMGAFSFSIYGLRWGIDGVARVYKPNDSSGSYSSPVSLADSTFVLTSSKNSELYSLRLRNDFSFHWRMTTALNFARETDSQSIAVSSMWRYRANAMQVLTGLSYTRFAFSGNLAYSSTNTELNQLAAPLMLILEHRHSIFYVSGKSQLWRLNRQGDYYYESFTLQIDPALGYVYRFTGRLWAGLSVGSQLVRVGRREFGSQPLLIDGKWAREINISFQLTYNIVPFGYDDELPLSDKLLLVSR